MYAARAIDLIREWAKEDLEKNLTDYLANAKSNKRALGNGGRIFRKLVKRSRIDTSRATAHHAINKLIDDDLHYDPSPFFSDMIRVVEERQVNRGGIHAILGELVVMERRSLREFKRRYLSFCPEAGEYVSLVGGPSKQDLEQLTEEISTLLPGASLKDMRSIFSKYTSKIEAFTLRDLIPDLCRHMVNMKARSLGHGIRDLFKDQRACFQDCFHILRKSGESAPPFSGALLHLLFKEELLRVLSSDSATRVELEHLEYLAPIVGSASAGGPTSAKSVRMVWETALKEPEVRHEVQAFFRRQIEGLANQPNETNIADIIHFLGLLKQVKAEPDLWESQNIYDELFRGTAFIDSGIKNLPSGFLELGQLLDFITEV